MKTSILNDVEESITLLKLVKKDLEHEDDIGLDADLLRSLLQLDEGYKEYTLSIDSQDEVPDGTTYYNEHGPNIEFYIEADAWHNISRALRVWKSKHEDWPSILNLDVGDMIDM